MIDLSQILEDFGSGAVGSDTSLELSDVAFEEKRLDAFEQGYKAGWDDAVQAQSDDKMRISADFARNLQELSFTYHEALNHVTKSMSPLFNQIVNKILPQMAHATLGVRVVELLNDVARTEAEQPVELATAPKNAAALHALLAQSVPMPISITEEASLGEGQVCIRFGSAEREIDIDPVLAGIAQAVQAFLHQAEEVSSYG